MAEKDAGGPARDSGGYEQGSPAVGFGLGLLAYGWWGIVFPLHLGLLNKLVGVDPNDPADQPAAAALSMEVLAHRVLFTMLLCLGLVAIGRQWKTLWSLLTNRGTLGLMSVTAVLIGLNWYAFTYSVAAGRLSEASLGYYISPLLIVLFGPLFFGERLRAMQWVSVVLAAVGVGVKTYLDGGLPWIALTVATSFSVYGLLRKRARATAATGLGVETMLLLPLAIGYAAWREGWLPFIGDGGGAPEPLAFGREGLWVSLLLVGVGVSTTIPLVSFAASARRLKMSVVGFMQFISPTCQFIIAALVYNEVSGSGFIVFGLIWCGVGVFSADSLLHQRRMRRTRRADAADERVADTEIQAAGAEN